MASVTIPYESAYAVFVSNSVPSYAARTYRAFPNLVDAHPHSQGALVSLVYNRGAGMGTSDRRREMREIRDVMRAKRFESVPDRIRSMKRIWPGASGRGLRGRRDSEADMFAHGNGALAPTQ